LDRLLFVSDLHLAPGREVLTARFEALLAREAGRCRRLYILGDLFDAWIGDDDPSPFARRIRDALRRFSEKSGLYLQHGNRDFLIGEGFAAAAGAHLLDETHLLPWSGLRCLLMHGDQLCTDDVDYQQMRPILRSPEFRRQALALPIPKRRALADEYRRRSGEALSLKPEEITDVNTDAVSRAMEAHRADLLIHGHTHRPALHRFRLSDGRTVRRAVLPDWRETSPRLGWVLEETELYWLELPAA